MERRNINRGYMKLTVWQDAISFYVHTVAVLQNWPYEMRCVASQQIAGVDSIHRNIAEGCQPTDSSNEASFSPYLTPPSGR